MALLLYLLVMVIFSTAIMLPVGHIIYSSTYLGHMPATRKAALWENMLYYFIAAYPPLSFAILALAGEYLLTDSIADTIPEMQGILLFCIGHFILCTYAVTVACYLQKLQKANVIFIVTSILSGGAYLYAGMFAFSEIIKN